jgi:hypothetical protein
MYVVKVVKNLHLYLITKTEITNEIMFLFTFASHICGYFIPQLFDNVSVVVQFVICVP